MTDERPVLTEVLEKRRGRFSASPGRRGAAITDGEGC